LAAALMVVAAVEAAVRRKVERLRQFLVEPRMLLVRPPM
jgi:hypothetical protein